jgi:hypothetical protein
LQTIDYDSCVPGTTRTANQPVLAASQGRPAEPKGQRQHRSPSFLPRSCAKYSNFTGNSNNTFDKHAGIIEEEDDINVVEESFRQAYRNSQADTICVPGLQEFAGSVRAITQSMSRFSVLLIRFGTLQVSMSACRSGQEEEISVRIKTHWSTYFQSLMRIKMAI